MILKGDCIEVMKALKPNSVDAIVTDPPYGLEFMGKEWDKLKCWDDGIVTKQIIEWRKAKREGGFATMQKSRTPRYDPSQKGGKYMQLWHTQWLTEAYRVLKPGGSMLVMGGTRTFHRLACAIEDSGFIIKDTLMWLYGSGFPKAQDLGKMIDKRMGKKRTVVGRKSKSVISEEWRKKEGRTDRLNDEFLDISIPSTPLAQHWDGFKVGGIKPAYEPIVWAVKPPEGSYVDNVLKYGVGAVNVDECRVESKDDLSGGTYGGIFSGTRDEEGNLCKAIGSGNKGRFPANIILDEEAGRLLDEQSGESKSKKCNRGNLDDIRSDNYHRSSGARLPNSDYERGHSDSGGASRFFYTAKASRSERNMGLEGMEEKDLHWSSGHKNPGSFQSDGTKKKATNAHPTVKPIKLFEWLIRLVTREGQIVLDPFLGSGTTAIAAHNAGRKCVGIEKEDEYLQIAKKRIDYWKSQPKQMELK